MQSTIYNPQSKSSVKKIARLSSLAAIISFGCTSQAQAVDCVSVDSGNWSTITWSCSHVPTSSDNVMISPSTTVTLDQDATVQIIEVAGGTFNASNKTLTLTAQYPLFIIMGMMGFNAGTSTVKLSDADHTLSNNITFYNLQWATPITVPRTMTIDSAITIATGGAFSLGGSSSTNKVTFTGIGSVSPAVTLTNCTSTVTGINCVGGGSPPVSAPIDLNFNKQPETFAIEIEVE